VPTAEASRFASPESYTPKHLAERILTSKSALEGERKQVTVLFADLKGSMELFAERDPEEARKILDPVLERMMEAVHRFEGTVNQVMGDGIMALFGAPLAHEDHAVRACYAALRMQESVKEHSEHVRRELGVPVSIRVGLNSGEVVVRAIGNDLHMDYTAVGQTTHLAARMEQAALPGSILIAPDTLLLAEGYVEVRRLGPVAIKGLDQPVEVHEVTGVGVARTRLQASAARGFTRFVGRDGELAHLRRALGRAAEGHGQVVAVVGEAGVGKSRLLYEFTHSHRLEGWLVLEASSVSYGKASGYLPVVDLLKTYFKIQDRDDHRGIREKITGKVLTLDETLRPTLPALLALLDVPLDDAQWQSLDPSQRRHRTLDGVKRLLLRESQLQPLLLVFEDLHWIDAETQGLLDTLVDSVPSARVLLLVNFRPGYQHSWSGKTYYSQLRLDTLPSESTAELLEALLGRDPGLEPLRQLLLRRGNPFFLEEIVRTLAETRVLAGERGAYRLIRPIRSLQVPATVQAILATRIDRLPVAEKQLLQTAAVIGKDVPFGVLEAISRPDEDVGRGLASLQAAEFLYEARLFPDLEYTFKHALTHEVVYASLLAERRRTLHARIVEAIERLYPDRLAERTEELAHHALRGEVWEKALAYLRDAGARALARAANGAAVALFDQALAVLPRLPTSDVTQGQAIDLRLDLRAALMLLGEFGRTGEVLKEAEELAAKLDDRPRRGRIAGALANLCWEMGDQDRAMAAGQRALEIATTVGDGALRDLADRYLGRCYYALGDYPRAIETLKRVVERRRADSPGRTVSLSPHVFLIQCLAETGAFAEGTSYGEEALRFAEVTDQAISLTAACTAVGRLYLRQGKVEKSIAVLERGLEMCQVVNLPVIFPTAASPLGAAYALAGRSTEALPLLEQAVERATAMRRMVDQSLWVAWLSEGLLWVGRVEEATDLAARALELAQTCGERANRAWILWLLGEIHAHGDARDFERSADDYRRALAEADELGLRPLRAHCWLGLGILNEQAGRTEEARTALHRARDLFRDMEMTFWLPETESALRRLGS
jgi:class 3 adenylate cyclase/tetratricopeptide (TPR) repeat protein